MKSRDLNRYLHTHVHSGINHNGQEVEAAQGFTDRWMDKQMWYIHTVKIGASLVAQTVKDLPTMQDIIQL